MQLAATKERSKSTNQRREKEREMGRCQNNTINLKIELGFRGDEDEDV